MENGLTVTHDRLVKWFESAEDVSQDSRARSELCRDYYDNKQWTPAERKVLEDRKQPCLTLNRIAPKVDALITMEDRSKTDPKAYPRTPAHEEGADAATDALRYVCDNVGFDETRSDVFTCMEIEGTGGVEVYVRPNKKGELEIQVKRIFWDRLFWDPHSREKDFSDARYLGVVQWMDYEDALAAFPEGLQALVDTKETAPISTAGTTYDDKPQQIWFDSARERIRIVHMCYRDRGVWHYCQFTQSGPVQGPGVSPYLNDEGEPEPSLIFQSAYIDREGNRYGPVTRLLDLQDEINKRRSKALHLISVRQTFGVKGAVEDKVRARSELAKPDGHLEINSNDFEYGKHFGILPTGDMATGQLNLLQEAKAEMDAQGANAALTGSETRDLSGRALQQLSQNSTLEIGPPYKSLRVWQKRVYRAIWNRVRQFWKEEKWIRVTDDTNKIRFVGLNIPVTLGEQLAKEGLTVTPEMIQMDPRLQQVVSYENNVSELDIDLVLDEAPDVVTLQQEQFDALVKFSGVGPGLIPPALLIEASSLRNKDKILERMKGNEEQQAQQAQVAQHAAELEMADKEADVTGKQAQTKKTQADTIKTQVETQMLPLQLIAKNTPPPGNGRNFGPPPSRAQ